MSAGAWFQVVEAFRPKTQDFGQTLADIIASPYIHPREAITKEVAQAVVARTALYKGGTPELAARVFMNSAAMAEIERTQGPDEQTEVIDNAIVAAAKDVQEEARKAREEAERDRLQSAEQVKLAQTRAEESERRREDEIEALRRASDEAALNEAERRDEAARNEAVRQQAAADRRAREHAEELAATKSAYDKELAERESELRREQKSSARRQRRNRLAWTAVVLTVLFVLGSLALGLDRAWQYVVAVGVCLGLLAAIDQLFQRRE